MGLCEVGKSARQKTIKKQERGSRLKTTKGLHVCGRRRWVIRNALYAPPVHRKNRKERAPGFLVRESRWTREKAKVSIKTTFRLARCDWGTPVEQRGNGLSSIWGNSFVKDAKGEAGSTQDVRHGGPIFEVGPGDKKTHEGQLEKKCQRKKTSLLKGADIFLPRIKGRRWVRGESKNVAGIEIFR